MNSALLFSLTNFLCINGFSLFSIVQVPISIFLPKVMLFIFVTMNWITFVPVVIYIFIISKPKRNVFIKKSNSDSFNFKLLLYSFFIHLIGISLIIFIIFKDSKNLFLFGEISGIFSFSFAFFAYVAEILLPLIKAKTKEWETKHLQDYLMSLNTDFYMNNDNETETFTTTLFEADKQSYFAAFSKYKALSPLSILLKAIANGVVGLVVVLFFNQYWFSL